MALVSHYNKKFSAESLVTGLPLVNNKLTPRLFVRAALAAGLKAKVQTRAAEKISPHTLPAVALLKNNQAALLTEITATGQVVLLNPRTGNTMAFHSLHEFANVYAGAVILVRQAPEHELLQDIFPTGQAWFWGTLALFKPLYVQVGLAALLINLFALAAPLFVMNVYDRVVPNAGIETLWVLASGVVVVYTFDFIFKQLRGYFIDVAGKGADILLASRLFQQVMNIRLGQQASSSGAFANQVRDFETLRDFFTSATLTTFIDIPFILLFVLVLAFIAGPVALVPLLAVPVVILLSLALQKPVEAAVRQAAKDTDTKHGHLIETVTGIETIKAMNAQSHMQTVWEQSVGVVSRLNMRTRFYAALGVNAAGYVQQLVSVIIIVWGAYRIINGDMSVGALIASTILTGRMLAPLGQAAALYGRYQQSKEALLNLNTIMNMQVERASGQNFVHITQLTGDIVFKDVSFKYPHNNINNLQHVNLHIKPGDKVAIIGRVGSGKSTIARLLLNLYNVTEGSILFDGLEIRQLDPAELRRHIAYIPQQHTLFKGTLRDNILLGNPQATQAMLIQAAKMAGVDEFARRHPMGYDMPVGEQGNMLSGGQRQAVAVARALVKNASVYVMDEPTSHMDNRSEELLIEHLKGVLHNKTCVLITHKYSLLELVDKLVFMEGGSVLAAGPKEKVLELIKSGKLKGRA